MARCWRIVVVLALASLAGAQTSYEIYRVRAGDSIEAVAERYDVSVASLIELNPFLKTRAPLENELLTVPIRRETVPEPAEAGPPPPPSGGGANGAGGVNGGPRVVDAPSRAVVSRSQPAGPAGPAPSGAPAATAGQAPVQQTFATSTIAGRLGLVTAADTAIVRHENGVTRELFRCGSGTRVLVVQQYGTWYGIRMVDRSLGWVDINAVQLTATELVEVQQPSGSTVGQAAIRVAMEYLGVPYRWGGNGFGGIDCSGLVQQSYRRQGVSLPRVSRDQANVGAPIPPDQLQAGDRLYFASGGGRIDHTGLYIGNGQFIHASGRRGMVVIENLFTPYYWRMYVGARR